MPALSVAERSLARRDPRPGRPRAPVAAPGAGGRRLGPGRYTPAFFGFFALGGIELT